MVRQWQTEKNIEHVEFFFEDGDEDRGRLKELCKPDGAEPSFLTKKTVQFQAADLAAYRTRSCFEEALDKDLTVEYSLKLKERFSDVWQNPHKAFYGNEERLEQLCVDRQIPRR